MSSPTDSEWDWESLRAQQQSRRQPKRIGQILADVMAVRGYAQADAARRRQEVWNQVVGPLLASHSRPAEIRRGVLTIVVSNSVTMQELSLQKNQLLQQVTHLLPEQRVRELRLRVGKLD